MYVAYRLYANARTDHAGVRSSRTASGRRGGSEMTMQAKTVELSAGTDPGPRQRRFGRTGAAGPRAAGGRAPVGRRRRSAGRRRAARDRPRSAARRAQDGDAARRTAGAAGRRAAAGRARRGARSSRRDARRQRHGRRDLPDGGRPAPGMARPSCAHALRQLREFPAAAVRSRSRSWRDAHRRVLVAGMQPLRLAFVRRLAAVRRLADQARHRRRALGRPRRAVHARQAACAATRYKVLAGVDKARHDPRGRWSCGASTGRR